MQSMLNFPKEYLEFYFSNNPLEDFLKLIPRNPKRIPRKFGERFPGRVSWGKISKKNLWHIYSKNLLKYFWRNFKKYSLSDSGKTILKNFWIFWNVHCRHFWRNPIRILYGNPKGIDEDISDWSLGKLLEDILKEFPKEYCRKFWSKSWKISEIFRK